MPNYEVLRSWLNLRHRCGHTELRATRRLRPSLLHDVDGDTFEVREAALLRREADWTKQEQNRAARRLCLACAQKERGSRC